MKIFILDRLNLRDVLEIDSSSGETRPGVSEIVHGTGQLSIIHGTKKLIALYADNGLLYFQVGNQTWAVSKEGLSFFNKSVPLTCGLFRFFLVTNGADKEVFRISYVNRRIIHWKNWIDVTYDDFDSYMDDIFLWLARECNDPKWRRELTDKWSKGVPTPSN